MVNQEDNDEHIKLINVADPRANYAMIQAIIRISMLNRAIYPINIMSFNKMRKN